MASFYRSYVKNTVSSRLFRSALGLIVLLIAGAIGYYFIEGFTLFDGFYQTFITITTIGFEHVRPLSTSGKILTIFIAIFGIGTVAYMASQVAQMVFESEVLQQRAMKSKLKKMQDHYIICGYGRIGQRVATVLTDANIPVVIVDNRETSIARIQQSGHIYVEGNAQDEGVLLEAGVQQAKGLVCALSKDPDNVFTTLLARELNENLFILARTNEQRNARKMLRAGASKVISPYEIGSDHMSNVLLRPRMVHFIESLMANNEEDHLFDECTIMEGAILNDKSLIEANLRNNYGVAVIAIIPSNTGQVVLNPSSDEKLRVGDTLIVLGDQSKIDKLRTLGCNDHRGLAERVKEFDFINDACIKPNLRRHYKNL